MVYNDVRIVLLLLVGASVSSCWPRDPARPLPELAQVDQDPPVRVRSGDPEFRQQGHKNLVGHGGLGALEQHQADLARLRGRHHRQYVIQPKFDVPALRGLSE